jgi:hypothetical protein
MNSMNDTNESHHLSSDHGDEPWKERVVEHSGGVLAALLWLFTAVVLRPGIDFLLLLAMLLSSVALFGMVTLRWGHGKSSSRATLATCLVAVIMMTYAWIDLAFLPQHAPAPFRMVLVLLWIVAGAYMARISREESAKKEA